jgi:hypothetical protein
LALLLLSDGEHRVDVLQTKLLTSLTEAHELLSEARDTLTKASRLLLRAEPRLNTGETELRTLQAKTARSLRTGQTKLATLQRPGLSKLLGAKTQAATCFRCACSSTGADLTQLPRKLRALHCAPCCGFKAACTELRGTARLLFKDVTLQFRLRLLATRAAKRAGRNRLRGKALLRDTPLTGDVSHRLLHNGFFKRIHVAHGRTRRQACDARTCRLKPKGRGLLECALRCCGRLTRPRGCDVCAGHALRCRGFYASRSTSKGRLSGSNSAGDLTRQSARVSK